MVPPIPGGFGRPPARVAEELSVLELEDLDLERTAAFDHLPFAVGAKSPQGEVTSRAGTCRKDVSPH